MISPRDLFVEISNQPVLENGESVGYFVKNSRMDALEELLSANSPQPVLAVPPEKWVNTDIHYAEENGFAEGWNACRAAMLNQAPVKQPSSNDVIGWVRSDYNSDDKRDPNAPLFMLGSNDPSEAWGVKYIPLSGNSPVIPDGWKLAPKKADESMIAEGNIMASCMIEAVGKIDVSLIYGAMLAAAPEKEVGPCTK